MGREVVSGLQRRAQLLAARLVDARAADVAHPFDDVVVTVVELGLKHLQVAHLEAGGGEGDLSGGGCEIVRGLESGAGGWRPLRL